MQMNIKNNFAKIIYVEQTLLRKFIRIDLNVLRSN